MNRLDTGFGERRYRTRLKYHTGWPELTALVDIFFLSLLFFALTSIVRVSGIPIDLPRVQTHTTAALEHFVISLSADSTGKGMVIYFRERPCANIDELRQQLSELHESSPRARVIIRADRTLLYENVAKVMDAAKDAHLSCFLAVEVPKERLGE